MRVCSRVSVCFGVCEYVYLNASVSLGRVCMSDFQSESA